MNFDDQEGSQYLLTMNHQFWALFILFALFITRIESDCGDNCNVCVGDTCQECDPDYVYFDYHGCVQCSSPPSNEYWLYYEMCSTCIEGEYLKTDYSCGLCTEISSNCELCSYTPGVGALCSLCNTGYYTIQTNCILCSATIANCALCDVGPECQTCASGYGLIRSNNTCQLCSTQYDPVLWEEGCNIDCEIGQYLDASNCLECKDVLMACTTCQDENICLECDLGFFLNTTSWKCELCLYYLPGCGACDLSTECIFCVAGYYLTTSLDCDQCGTSIPGCLICSNSTVCEECHADYYLSAGNCMPCLGINANCIRCNHTDYCLECQLGYFLNSVDLCEKCITGCIICDMHNGSHCYQCALGYYDIDGDCLRCPSNCLACMNDTYCLECEGQMTFDGTGGCTDCPAHCITCNQSMACFQCSLGFYQQDGDCFMCPQGCEICNASSNTCFACFEGYDFVAANNQCVKCDDSYPHCMSCNTTQCTECYEGYFVNSLTAQCEGCSFYMHACEICEAEDSCLHCAPGHLLAGPNLGNNSCDSCPLGCVDCTSTTDCVLCSSAYYLNINQCLRCEFPCVTCSDQTTCISCPLQYYLSGGTCLPCNGSLPFCEACYLVEPAEWTCTQCSVGHYPDNNECINCEPHCVECDNSTFCISCELGFYVDITNGSVCTSCAPQCAGCVSETNCSSCQEGFFLDTVLDQCILCTVQLGSGCLACESDSVCLICSHGFFVNATFNCQACSTAMSNCMYCEDINTCIACDFGYVVAGDQMSCQSCAINIQRCMNCSDLSTCSMCEPGYWLRTPSDCAVCGFQCMHCESDTLCMECHHGFTLVLGECQLCTQFLQGCRICNTNASVCLECYEGYYLSGEQCQICEHAMNGCEDCSSNSTCSLCQSGFYLDNNICLTCNSAIEGCLLCESNVNCTLCHDGKYSLPDGSCEECSVAMPGCSECIDVDTCLICMNGFYISSSDCILCHDTIPGCFICQDSNTCLRCQSGYFLNNLNLCEECEMEGCEICGEHNSSYCITCNGEYYMSVPGICTPCRSADPNCVFCQDELSCDKCDAGFYSNGTQCVLCSQTMVGCSLCSDATTCLECKSSFTLNVDQCDLCEITLPGCARCQDQSTCQECEAAFYLTPSDTCLKCSLITGCLFCYNSSLCVFCDTSYFETGGLCEKCSDHLPGCYSCSSASVCTSCSGGYRLTFSSECELMNLHSANYLTEGNLTLKTYWVSQHELMHVILLKGSAGTFRRDDSVDWNSQVFIFIETNRGDELPLVIERVEWGADSLTLLLYTDNPLLLDELDMKMPFARRRLQSSIALDSRTRLKMTEQTKNNIMPSYNAAGPIALSYDLDNAEFYASYLKYHSNFLLQIIGALIVLILFIKYSVKALVTVPESLNPGNIIPHILAFKVGALLLFPTYMEYVQFCTGFMYADFPWANETFGNALGDMRDISPFSYQVFFVNMNMGSMYMLAMLIILLLVVVTVVLGKKLKREYQMHAYLRFLYNFFVFGAIFAGCSSLQGAIYNPSLTLSANGFFYILGIFIYSALFCESLFKFYQNHVVYFWRLRVLVKATILALAHFSPIYLLSVAVMIDLILLAIEYRLCRYPHYFRFWWLYAHITADLTLILLVFLPVIELSLLVVTLLIVSVIVCESVMHYREMRKNHKLLKIPEEYQQSIIFARQNNEAGLSLEKDLVIDEKQKDLNMKSEKDEPGDLFVYEEDDYKKIEIKPKQKLNRELKRERKFGKKQFVEENKIDQDIVFYTFEKEDEIIVTDLDEGEKVSIGERRKQWNKNKSEKKKRKDLFQEKEKEEEGQDEIFFSEDIISDFQNQMKEKDDQQSEL